MLQPALVCDIGLFRVFENAVRFYDFDLLVLSLVSQDLYGVLNRLFYVESRFVFVQLTISYLSEVEYIADVEAHQLRGSELLELRFLDLFQNFHGF